MCFIFRGKVAVNIKINIVRNHTEFTDLHGFHEFAGIYTLVRPVARIHRTR